MKKPDSFIASFQFINANGITWELIIYVNPEIEWKVQIDKNYPLFFNMN